MSNVQCPMYNVQCTMSNVQCPMYNVQCTIHNVQFTMYMPFYKFFPLSMQRKSTKLEKHLLKTILFMFKDHKKVRKSAPSLLK